MLNESIAYDPFAVADDAEITNKLFLAALRTGHGPTGLRWSAPTGGFSKRGWAMAEASMAIAAELEASKVYRDACSFCGVRADHGCKHNTL